MLVAKPRRVIMLARHLCFVAVLTTSVLACSDPNESATVPHATTELVAGTDLKRVTLTEQAGERIGVKTVLVGETALIRKRVADVLYIPELGAMVTTPLAGTLLPPAEGAPPAGTALGVGQSVLRLAPASGAPVIEVRAPRDSVLIRLHAAPGQNVIALQPLFEYADISRVWIRVAMSPSEMNNIGRNLPVTVIAGSQSSPPRLSAQPVPAPSIQAALGLFYLVDAPFHGLYPGQKVAVELPDSAPKRKVVPYSAIVYDLRGEAWVYTIPSPLSFVRQRVTVESVEGDLAILKDGLEINTQIVSMGAAQIYGVELGAGN